MGLFPVRWRLYRFGLHCLLLPGAFEFVESVIVRCFCRRAGRSAGNSGVGLLTNIALLVVFAMFRGTSEVATLSVISVSSGPALFAAAVVGGAAYAALTWEIAPSWTAFGGHFACCSRRIKDRIQRGLSPAICGPIGSRIGSVHCVFSSIGCDCRGAFWRSLCFNTASFFSDIIRQAPEVCPATTINLQILDIDAGLLFYFALGGTGIIGAALAGWASNNKYSLLGGLRAASQMVSYEVTMGLTLIGAIMIYGTLRIDQMIEWQQTHAWGIFVQPLAFILFFTAAVAESKRVPFDLPEGESEIVAGYFTEYSGMKFAMFFFAEYVTIVTSAALMVALFLGGWHLPFIDHQGIRIAIGGVIYWQLALPQIVVVLLSLGAFIAKTLFLCWLQLVRWTVPRFRYDQLMKLGWRILRPFQL